MVFSPVHQWSHSALKPSTEIKSNFDFFLSPGTPPKGLLVYLNHQNKAIQKMIAKKYYFNQMEVFIMENYGRCKNCEYGEPSGCSWKWSCTWYHTLEDPDKLRDCNRYKERD